MWGTRPVTFVNAVVVGPRGHVFPSIRLRGGKIDSLGAGPQRRDAVVDLNEAVVLPGLINAHDHLELNSFARLKWRARYCNVREWIADFQPRFASDPSLAGAIPETLDDRLWVGGLKNLLAGVTTVCHHNPLYRALRTRYPVRVVSEFGFSHSLGVDGDQLANAHRRTPPEWPWIVHAAEGVDAEAAREIAMLDQLGCLAANTVLVHGVAATTVDAQRVLDRGGALIWCPASNEFLFGKTADVRPFDHAARLALGSDSRLSGERDLLDELRTARATRQLGPQSLFHAVTDGAARVLRLRGAGHLMAGRPADLCAIRPLSSDPFETLVSASRADIRLTMIAGTPLVSDPDLALVFDGRHGGCDVRVDGRPKRLARWIADRAARLGVGEPGLELSPC